MIITHHLGENVVRRSNQTNPMFLLSNGLGGFTFLGTGDNVSRFQGAYFAENDEYFKVIESIGIFKGDVVELRNNFFNIERIYNNCLDRFFSNHTDSLLYEVMNHKGFIDLILDCRKIYDFNDEGRIYNISNEKDCIIIEYVKYTDKTLKDVDYKIYIAIKGAKEISKIDQWENRSYEFDKKRNSTPSERFVYHGFKIKVDDNIRLVLSYSTDKDTAIKNSEHGMDNFDFIKKSKENYVKTLTGSHIKTNNKEINFAYKSCLNAMDSYIVDNESIKGLFAGYPWFTQVWTRDEAISLKSLMLEEKFADAKNFLFRQLKNILPDGRIPNRFPESKLGSADGVGWVYKRIYDLIKTLQEKGRLDEFISKDDLKFIENQLRISIRRLLKHHSKDGLCYNEPLETWMDTYYKDDVRSGARIEIQALRLSMYQLMIFLSNLNEHPKEHLYQELIDLTKDRVRSKFWKKPALYDGEDDPTIRSNIFLAYYVYPDLLSKREWISCFDDALKKLWYSWGGVSTIDKSHKYHTIDYTGENNVSYHRGDSWYYINNLAALCLYRLDKHRFKTEINKIISASTEEILFKGIIGYHAEVSSGRESLSQGSLAQCWSSALYIEMIDEIFQ